LRTMTCFVRKEDECEGMVFPTPVSIILLKGDEKRRFK